MPDDLVHVRYMVDDVDAAIDFYTTHFGFTLNMSAAPAFADVVRGNLRLLLSGPRSSAGRPMPDGRAPQPGGWNRIHFVVDDIAADVARLRAAGLTFRNDIISGPGGRQILLEDPAGNPIELFQPAAGCPADAPDPRRGPAGVGSDRVHRLRRAARAYRAAARAVRHAATVAAGARVRGRDRGDQPAARAGVDADGDLLRLAAARGRRC